ncbi:MAG: LCP family protein [Enterococcus sp.]|nr:LCP family protein [Enterococcus sp.]
MADNYRRYRATGANRTSSRPSGPASSSRNLNTAQVSAAKAGNRHTGRSATPVSSGNPSYSAVLAARKKKRRGKYIRRGILAVLALIVIGTGVGAFAYFSNIENNMHAGVDDNLLNSLSNRTYTGDPFYCVVMGVDGSKERAGGGQVDNNNYRSDSIMLLRLDPKNKKVTAISLHRDTQMDMGEYGTQKLNAAHSIGGPAYTVQMVSKLCNGLPISHYGEINFDAFKEAVDAVGGVEITLPMDINDPMAEVNLKAGKQTLNGAQALGLCRSRHAYDDYGDGDVYRAANQRLVLSALAQKLLSSDVNTIASTVEKLSKYVTTDISLSDAVSIALAYKDFDASKDFYSAMEPTEGVYQNGAWYEVLNQDKWNKMLKRTDQGLPPLDATVVDDNGAILSTAGDQASNSSSSSGSSSGSSSSGSSSN